MMCLPFCGSKHAEKRAQDLCPVSQDDFLISGPTLGNVSKLIMTQHYRPARNAQNMAQALPKTAARDSYGRHFYNISEHRPQPLIQRRQGMRL